MFTSGLRYRAGQRQQLVQLLRLAALYFCQTNQRPLGALKSTGNEEYCCAGDCYRRSDNDRSNRVTALRGDGVSTIAPKNPRGLSWDCCAPSTTVLRLRMASVKRFCWIAVSFIGYFRLNINNIGWITLVPPVPNVWKATESNYTSGGLMYCW
ncbi:hypothetical protein PI124_g8338 [Phytophthora idaei]|nr:hypothetical protein PI124_g8338 [Phytophthora idaei]